MNTKKHPNMQTQADNLQQCYQGLYLEMNQMALFLVNIISGDIIDLPDTPNINKEKQEKILSLSHELWALTYPSTLDEHDKMLTKLQTCANYFSESVSAPLAKFIYYQEDVDSQRMKNSEVQDDNSAEQKDRRNSSRYGPSCDE